MCDFEKIITEDIVSQLLTYMIVHSDIDARKRKLESLINDLVSKDILQKFTVKYDEKDFADLRFWTNYSLFPNFRTVLALNISSEDLKLV